MDNKKRFDQLESLLVDIARRQDQQAEQIAQIMEVLNRQGEAIARQEVRLDTIDRRLDTIDRHLNTIGGHLDTIGGRLDTIGGRLDDVGEQIGDIINIFKISEARHTEAERRQDELMTEIRQQGQRQDVVVDALKVLLKRQQATDSRLDDLVQTELQMLQLMRRDAEQLDNHAPRLKRLEDQVFPAAD